MIGLVFSTHHFKLPRAAAASSASCRFRSGLVPFRAGNVPAHEAAVLEGRAHWLIVWGSLSSASAVAGAVRPWVNGHMACHRSRPRGVAARIVRWCRSLAFISHCSRNRSIPLTPSNNPSLAHGQINQASHKFTPSPSHFTLALV